MPYRVEIGSGADAQLAKLDSAIGASVERKILWLAENAAAVVHRRLVGMTDDLAGLCKLRVATDASSTGSITRRLSSASTASNTAPKSIAISNQLYEGRSFHHHENEEEDI